MKRSDATFFGVRVLAVPLAAILMVVLGLSAPATATVEDEAAPDVEATADAVMESVNNGDIIVHAPESALNASQATVEDVESDEGIYTTVAVPIEDSYSMLSNLTVVFDEAGNVSQYSETLYHENDLGNFQLTLYTNGELVKDEDMEVAYMADAELVEDMENSAPVEGDCTQTESTEVGTMSVGAVATCIAGSLGVGGVTAYLIAGACAGSCVGQVYPVCAACIGGYALLGSAGVGAVAACFQLL